MAMNKKGIFFSIIALVLVLLFVASTRPGPELSFRSSQELILVSNLNDFLRDMEVNYTAGLLKASTVRAVRVTLDEVNRTKEDFSDISATLGELMLTGDAGAVNQADELLMQEYRLPEQLQIIEDFVQKTYNVNFSVQVLSVQVSEDTPWHIRAEMDIAYNLTSPLASWNRTTTVITQIPIFRLYDPLLLREDGQEVPISNILSSSMNVTDFYDGDFYDIQPTWTALELQEMFRDNLSVYDPNAPSFLARLDGSYDNSGCCGYEQFVHKTDDESYIDHKYHGSQPDREKLFRVNGVTPKLVVDHNELRKYNLCQDTGQVTPIDGILGPQYYSQGCF